MQQRLPSLLNPPLAFGHRGAKSLARDNTLDSFELALKLGANGLETDAWITSDGKVVLDHDGVVKRRGRTINISRLTRTELPSHIPELTELFLTCGTNFDLSIDVKNEEAFEQIIKDADRYGFLQQRLWLCHPNVDDLMNVRQKYSEVKLVNSVRLARIKEGPERRCALLAGEGISAINMHHTDWNGGLVTMAHKFGLTAFGWDAQFDHVLENGYRMGLDGIFSDYVDRLVDAYRNQIGHAPRC